MRLSKIASKYRDELKERKFSKFDQGFILIYNEMITGWRDELRNPETELHGTYAIDPCNKIFVALGGNDMDGAKQWVTLKEFNKHERDKNTIFEKKYENKLVKIFIKKDKIKIEFTIFKNNGDILLKRSNVFNSLEDFYNSSKNKNYKASIVLEDAEFQKLLLEEKF